MSIHTFKGINYIEITGGLSVGSSIDEQASGINDLSLIGTHLVIPRFVDNIPVIEIGRYAFYQCSQIMKITILARITTIRSRGFSCCFNVYEIFVPQTCNMIENFGFSFYDYAGDKAGPFVNIYFESGSQLRHLYDNSICNKIVVNLFFCTPITLITTQTLFARVEYYNIFTPVSFSFPGLPINMITSPCSHEPNLKISCQNEINHINQALLFIIIQLLEFFIQ